jgi:hypothetical protein
MSTIQGINFKGAGDNSVLAGVAGKSITVSKLALASLAPVNVTVKGTGVGPLGVKVEAQDFTSLCPIALAAGEALVLTADTDVAVGGFIEYSQA